MVRQLTYKDAGVDLDAVALFQQMIKERIEAAWPCGGEEVGKFAGGGPIPFGAKRFGVSTDGTGSKILFAAMIDMLAGIGQDAVAMAAVDTYAEGYEPKYLTDTLKVARLKPTVHIRIIDSVIRACRASGCRLIAGETAQEPYMFRHPWMVCLDAACIGFPLSELAFSPIREGQKVYGWPSYGIASNGFSLASKVFDLEKIRGTWTRVSRRQPELGESLAEALLRSTPIWISQIETQRKRGVRFAGHAHITGGGMPGNIPRILPPDCKVMIDRNLWERPPIFSLIQRKGRIAQEEMERVFNNGVMMVSIVSEGGEDINDSNAVLIGGVGRRMDNGAQVEIFGQYR